MMLLQAADAVKPLDVVALVQVSFTGLALLISAIGGIYAAVAAASAKRAEAVSLGNKATIELVERNTNSMTKEIAQLNRKEGSLEGERKGKLAAELLAEALAEGQRQGREMAREEAKAGALHGMVAPVSVPVPVIDEKLVDAITSHTAVVETVVAAAAAAEKK